MKIEKVNDHQIRCTLTKADLADRELKISELAYGTEKAKSLFRDMMQQASAKFGFEADDIPLMIEAIPPKVLLLPPASRCATHAVSYLSGRGIDREVIDFCLATGRLYESEGRYHNVVFVGHDQYGKARYANLRGIGSDFKGECNGSDKRFSFNIPAENSKILHLFESAIDLLSFATIRKLNGMEWRKDHLLSLAGVYQPREKIEESAVPLALTKYLSDHPEIKLIVLRLDNDRAGLMAAKALTAVLPKDYTVTTSLPSRGKDYNDCLCMHLGIPVTRSKEKNKER